MPRNAQVVSIWEPGSTCRPSRRGAYFPQARHVVAPADPETTMAKGLDKKKEQKKKPAKTLKEKRAEKSEKKAGKN
jgi:hypothetical protein